MLIVMINMRAIDTEAVPVVTVEFDQFWLDFSVWMLKILHCCRVHESGGKRKTSYGPHGVSCHVLCRRVHE